MLEGLLRSTLRVYRTTLEELRTTPQVFLTTVWNSWLVPELNIGNVLHGLVIDDVTLTCNHMLHESDSNPDMKGFTLEEEQQLS